jgi:glycine/D-amino acid oxidase-like deaminating enzyme
MRTRFGVSPWVDAVPKARRPDYPRLKGELTADVVVMGGGLTGCAAAQAAAAAGLKTILVEADRVGLLSATAPGLLLPEPGPDFTAVAKARGLRIARRIFETWRQASPDAAALVRRLGIRCQLEPCDSLIVAAAADETLLRREFQAREAAGLEVAWMPQKVVRAATGLEFAAGIKQRGAFALDPYSACLGLAAAAVKARAILFERTGVKKIRVGQKAIEVVTEGGLVRASTLIVATGAPTADFKQLRRHFTERESYLVVTEPVPAPLRRQLGKSDGAKAHSTLRDVATPHHRIGWTRDGRLMIAGADQPAIPERARAAVLVQRTGQLMYETMMMNTAIAGLRPEIGWHHSYAQTADGLMFIGPHRNFPRHLFALGHGGDSITGAFLAARILVRALEGSPAKGDDDLGWADRLS